PATSPQKFQASANTTHGSYGMQKSSYSAGARGFGIRHHKLSLDGWRQNSQYSREGTTITADLPAGANSRFLILGNHTSLKAYIPSSLNIDDFNQNPQNAAPAWLAAKGFEQYDMVMAGVGFERTAGKIRP